MNTVSGLVLLLGVICATSAHPQHGTRCPSLYPYMEKRAYYPGQRCMGSCPHEPHKKYTMVCQKDGTWLKFDDVCGLAYKKTSGSSIHHVYKPTTHTVYQVQKQTHCPSLYPYMEKRVYYPGQTCMGSCPHQPHKKYRMLCQEDGTWLKYDTICGVSQGTTSGSSVHHVQKPAATPEVNHYVYKPSPATYYHANKATNKVTHHVYKPSPQSHYNANKATNKVIHHTYKQKPQPSYQYYYYTPKKVTCPFMSTYMDPKYIHQSFDVGARMKFPCLKQKGHFFMAWCDTNGVWMMNPGSCSFQKPKKGLPFWLFFLLGQKKGLGPQEPQSPTPPLPTDPYFVPTDPYIVPTDPPYTMPPYV